MNSFSHSRYQLAALMATSRRNLKLNKIVRTYSNKRQRPEIEDPDIPKNILEEKQTAHLQKKFGVPYDCKPFKMLLDKNKKYFWCSCGQGHRQPLCDGTHRVQTMFITMKPIRFQVTETKEYWLCNCKHTKNRPFCDGSHRDSTIVEACKNKHVCTG